MEYVITVIIIAALFGLLSLTPMFRSREEDCEDGSNSGNACKSCGIAGSCSAAAENLPQR